MKFMGKNTFIQKVYGFPQNAVRLELSDCNKGWFGDFVGFFWFFFFFFFFLEGKTDDLESVRNISSPRERKTFDWY